ncbi:uncharacterized protein CCOS01_16628, partial [Colletotrichum costaricense]
CLFPRVIGLSVAKKDRVVLRLILLSYDLSAQLLSETVQHGICYVVIPALSRREQKNSGDTCGCHFHKWTRMINASGQLAPLAAAAHHPSSLRRMRVAIKNPVYESGYHIGTGRFIGDREKVFGATAPSTPLGPDDENASKKSLQGTAILEDYRKSWVLVDVPVDLSLNLSEAEQNYPLTAAHGRSRMNEGQFMSGCSDRQASAALRELSWAVLSRTRMVPRRKYIVGKGAIRET